MTHDPVRIALLIAPDSVGIPAILGFSQVAAVKGWEYQIYLLTGSGAELMRDDDPDLVVTGIGVHNEPEMQQVIQGRLVISLFEREDQHGIPLAARLDHRAIGAAAARHLLVRGVRTFFVYGIGGLFFAEQRAAAFAETVTAAGGSLVRWPEERLLAPDGESMIHRLEPLLKVLPRAAGVFTPCDEWGKLLTSHLRRLGVRVPDHLAIISADNNELACMMSVPPLSSVSIPWSRVGQEAALLADRLVRGLTPGEPPLIGPGPIVTRRSSQITVVHDTDVAAALGFIRANAHRPLGVPDVVREVVCSRRRLELAFRRLLGSSILDAIRDARLEQVKELLASTDLSVEEIAGLSGFRDASALANTFKQRVGCTASAYRLELRLRGQT